MVTRDCVYISNGTITVIFIPIAADIVSSDSKVLQIKNLA